MAFQPQLSHFAQKYGPLTGRNFSGLTPFAQTFPQSMTREAQKQLMEREEYQRAVLLGFTSRELVQLDVISGRKLKDSNLQNGIHPVMARDRWEGTPPYPHHKRNHTYRLVNGNGFWAVSNPEVWEVLVPCLRLSSRFLMSMHSLPWFDALINGQRKPIPKERGFYGDSVERLFSYHVPPAASPEATAIVRDEMLEALRVKWNLRFYFLNAFEYPDGSPLKPPCSVLGLTAMNEEEMMKNPSGNPDWCISIFIGYDRLQSLMRKDLSPAQKLLIEWEVANTITHEVMHAIQAPLCSNLFRRVEPYFEQIPVAEIGLDYEVRVQGGITCIMMGRPGYISLGYWVDKGYPSHEHANLTGPFTKVLVNPGPLDEIVRHPIPVTFYQDMQQDEFWSVGIRMFGFPLLHYRSIREGSRISYKHHYNWLSRKFEWSYEGQPVRMSADLPFQVASDAFQDKLSKLETMIGLTPYQRAARNFGREIVRSAKEECVFWANFNMQEANMRKLLTQSSRPGQDEEEQAGLAKNMTTSIAEAVCFHHNMVVSINSIEQETSTAYKERRDQLLIWNRGCRRFVIDLLKISIPDEDRDAMEKLEIVLLGLEACRMKLYSPLSGPHEVEDGREFAEILFASNSNGQVRRQVCKKILANPRNSMYGTCCADIMICGLDTQVQDGWEGRRDLLTKHIERFVKLLAEDIKHWVAPLKDWEIIATKTRDNIVQNHQAPVPEVDVSNES